MQLISARTEYAPINGVEPEPGLYERGHFLDYVTNRPVRIEEMVGGTGFEPVTPTVSL